MTTAAVAVACLSGCMSDNKVKDRTEARGLFRRISSLTRVYTGKVASAPDSASWAQACLEFEDSLEKINFSVSPDTDLLLTEGQNDTIHNLTVKYIEARDRRIQEILHPVVPTDTVAADSITASEAGASRSPGN